jgi:capsid portal protein
MEKKMVHVEDSIEVTDDIDDLSYFGFDSIPISEDPFLKVSYNSLSQKMKRKANKLSKKYVGEDGTETKYIDPETLDGYTLYDIVNPPYDLDNLSDLFDSSAIHNASVSARVMNTVGLGFQFQETLKARRKIEKSTDNEDKLYRVRKELQDEKERLEELFENLNVEETFIETMIKVWQDVLTI